MAVAVAGPIARTAAPKGTSRSSRELQRTRGEWEKTEDLREEPHLAWGEGEEGLLAGFPTASNRSCGRCIRSKCRMRTVESAYVEHFAWT